MPKISIILPTYNVEPYIERALQSCINQTFKDIEIIVVDDCGNDKSIEIAKNYAKKDERIKIIHNKKNLGTFASRNIGVFNSNADYIMFLDPDDYLELNACETINSYLDKKNQLIIFNFFNHGQSNLNIDFVCEDIQNFLLRYCIVFYKYHFLNPVFNKVYTKELLLQSLINIDAYARILMTEDLYLNFLYIQNIKDIYFLNENLYHYCENLNSITNEKQYIKIKSIIQDIEFVNHKLLFMCNNISKEYFLATRLSIYHSEIYKLDLTYKYLTKKFFKKLMLKIKRKMVKIKMKKYIKLAKNILKEKNVSSSL
ncbi:glycosyltransferase family 2 protein [Campylobacter molothri]|uniref:glycosyltransferase family 2 protein n=1 Tax=Campylobacter molothri TaxID=1032242 RepID=UPI00301E1FF5|nr:glycosyltransferase family 2 protein [Campylobacter sp. RM9753]